MSEQEIYDSLIAPTAWYQEQLTLAKGAVKKSDLIIEIGPHIGTLAAELTKQKKIVVGVDKDPNALIYTAHKVMKTKGIFMPKEADIQTYTSNGTTYTGAVSLANIGAFQDPQRAVTNIYNVLEQGAPFVVTGIDSKSAEEFLKRNHMDAILIAKKYRNTLSIDEEQLMARRRERARTRIDSMERTANILSANGFAIDQTITFLNGTAYMVVGRKK